MEQYVSTNSAWKGYLVIVRLFVARSCSLALGKDYTPLYKGAI